MIVCYISVDLLLGCARKDSSGGFTCHNSLYYYLFFPCEISEVSWPIFVKFCHMVRSVSTFIVPEQKFGGLSPKKFRCQKYAKFGAISDHFHLWLCISPEQIEISKIGKLGDSQRFLPRSVKKVRLTLVHCNPNPNNNPNPEADMQTCL